jgi:hypothetical protein
LKSISRFPASQVILVPNYSLSQFKPLLRLYFTLAIPTNPLGIPENLHSLFASLQPPHKTFPNSPTSIATKSDDWQQGKLSKKTRAKNENSKREID